MVFSFSFSLSFFFCVFLFSILPFFFRGRPSNWGHGALTEFGVAERSLIFLGRTSNWGLGLMEFGAAERSLILVDLKIGV